MEPRFARPEVVVEVNAPLADAIVAALRRRRCPAWTAESDGGYVVLVPQGRRDEALQLISAAMDDLAASHDDRRQPAIADADEEEPGRRLLLPRLRGAGIAILLVPMLVVALSAVHLSARYAAVLVVAGMAAIAALRIRARRDE